MNNKNTNSILHSSFCFQQRDVHLNQKGFGLIGALIGGVISLIVIGTVNNLVLRSIKKSSETEKIMRILNDKQRIIGWFKNDLICAKTLEEYPLSETDKTNGKTLYDSTTTKLEIRKSSSSVLESFDPGDLNSIEKIVMKQTSVENNFALFFYEKSLDSENLLYERTPQEATQPIMTCGTTIEGKYVIEKCGPVCLLCPDAGQERFNGTCTPKCSEGQVRQKDSGSCVCAEGLVEVEGQCQCPEAGEEFFEGQCVPVCTGELTRQDDGECGCAREQEKKEEGSDQCQCPVGTELSADQCVLACTGGQEIKTDADGSTFCKCPGNQMIKKDENGQNGQCVCPGKLILNETTGECEQGANCQLPDETNLLHTRTSEPSYSSVYCKNADTSRKYWCTTRQGYDNGVPSRLWDRQKELNPIYYCYNGERSIIPRDPYAAGGECTLEFLIEDDRSNGTSLRDRRRQDNKGELNPGDIVEVPESRRNDTTICYKPPPEPTE